MLDAPAEPELLARIDRYLDAAPRTGARTEAVGPFTVFVNEGHGWRYYARPTLGAGPCSIDDVRDVRARQRELGQPEAIEWIAERSPEVGGAARHDGMRVVEHPLMVLDADPPPQGPSVDAEIGIVAADDDLAVLNAVAHVAFAAPGTAIGQAGAVEAAAAAAGQLAETLDFQRGRMLSELTVAVAAKVSGVVAAVGWHQPLDGASEIVGVATLPAFRRRGLGAAVTARLVEDAIGRGIETVFLSADGDDVARVYASVGFRRVGTACAAAVASA